MMDEDFRDIKRIKDFREWFKKNKDNYLQKRAKMFKLLFTIDSDFMIYKRKQSEKK